MWKLLIIARRPQDTKQGLGQNNNPAETLTSMTGLSFSPIVKILIYIPHNFTCKLDLKAVNTTAVFSALIL